MSWEAQRIARLVAVWDALDPVAAMTNREIVAALSGRVGATSVPPALDRLERMGAAVNEPGLLDGSRGYGNQWTRRGARPTNDDLPV